MAISVYKVVRVACHSRALIGLFSPGAYETNQLEIFHITPTRGTIVQKSTKYVKLTRSVFPWVTFPELVYCG